MRTTIAIVLGLIVLCLAAPIVSARQTEGLCANVIVPQMELAGLDVEMYATVLGCEQNSSLWIQRTVSQSQDGRWPVTLDARGQSLMADVDELSTSDAFLYSIRFDRSSSEIVTVGAGGQVNRTDIANSLVSTEPNWLNNYADDYARDIEVYLLNNAGHQPELVGYIQWFMSRRDATLQVMSSSQNPMASAAFLANWGYLQWPWPWQLADPVAISGYLEAMGVSSEDSVANEEREFPVGVYGCQDDDCFQLSGVTIHYESADRTHLGACTTEAVEGPNGQGAWCYFKHAPGVSTKLTVLESTLPYEWVMSSANPMTYLVPENPDGELGPVYFEVVPRQLSHTTTTNAS